MLILHFFSCKPLAMVSTVGGDILTSYYNSSPFFVFLKVTINYKRF